MSDKEKIRILQEALRIACKFLRDNPGCDLDPYLKMGMVQALTGGEQDPEGKKYQRFFIHRAVENLNGKDVK